MTDELKEINDLIIEQCVQIFEKEGGWKAFYVINPKTTELMVQGYSEDSEEDIREEWGKKVLEVIENDGGRERQAE